MNQIKTLLVVQRDETTRIVGIKTTSIQVQFGYEWWAKHDCYVLLWYFNCLAGGTTSEEGMSRKRTPKGTQVDKSEICLSCFVEFA